MKKSLKLFIIVAMAASLLQGCSVVPLTGRKQLSLVPESEMISMSLTNYGDFLKQNTLSTDKANSAMVREVGAKISAAVIKYFTDNNLADRLQGYQWEFNLVKNDTTINAWCMPGGKVVVYSGLLPVTKDKNGLVLLPYSREHELEADKLGLIFMAMAGFDPQTAVPFWERMAKSGGSKPPEFLSTHPSDQTRIDKIKAALPEALKYYRK